MKFEFLLMPTRDMAASLALYRDGLGWQEAWREGDATVALIIPGSDVQLMLDSNDPDAAVGPMFVVDKVHDFHASRPSELRIKVEPDAIPGGYMATYEDSSGNPIYVLDQSEDATAESATA